MTDTEGVFFDMNPSDYHSEKLWSSPSLSASIGKCLVPNRQFSATPLHAWCSHPKLNPNFKPLNKAAFDIGNAAHEHTVGRGRGIVVIDADDFRTKESRNERDKAYAEDRIPVLRVQAEQLMEMKAIRDSVLVDAPWGHPFIEGQAEVCLRWKEKTKWGPIWCKALVDWLPDVRPIDRGIDYKTTGQSANPALWERRQMANLGMDISAAFHVRGYRALGLGHSIDYLWVIQESNEPYACSIVGYGDAELRASDVYVQGMIELWAKCLHSKQWPGYDLMPHMAESPQTRFMRRVNLLSETDHVNSEDIARNL